MIKGDTLDPKGLIEDSYRIDGIRIEECRSILVDWALSRPLEGTTPETFQQLLDRFAEGREDHPMTQVLRDGLKTPAATGRRGGRAARVPRS